MRQQAPRPAVSVVMPVYNEAAWVGAAIASILQQTVTELELVIVDNGSQDETPAILARLTDPRVRVFRLPRNLGSAAAGNRAVQEARAPLIARMDADDVALPQRLEHQLRAFAARPELALLGAQASPMDPRGRPLRTPLAPRLLTRTGIAWKSLFGSPVVHATALFTRAAFEAAGGYDERMPRSSDFALFSRIQRTQPVANLPQVLLRARDLPRAQLQDPAYDALMRAVLEDNARHLLVPSSAPAGLDGMIAAWPDVALMLRGTGVRPLGGWQAVPRALAALRHRVLERCSDPAAAREIAQDLRHVRCAASWNGLRWRRAGALRTVADTFARHPLFATRYFACRLADAACRTG